jgi:uncharacterized protein
MKVLCIDGGGIRGVFAVAILESIERELGEPIGNVFDVVAGTSTGAIIAASIALKKEMSEILEQYKLYGEKIFLRQAKVGIFKTVYSDRYLRRFFQKAFGELMLRDIEKPLIIPAVDLTHGNPYVHRTKFGSAEQENDLSVKLWDAVLSSCSAPVYFPPNNVENRFLSIDGGLWANNPSLVCITEVMRNFHEKINDIQILSIGTGKQKIDFYGKDDKDWGVKQWLPFHLPTMKVTPKLLDLALHLSSESVSYHCEHLLGSNYLRINEDLGGEIPFDEVKYMEHLIKLGRKCIDKTKSEIIHFLTE